MRVLVCGGRDFTDEVAVFRALDALHERRPVTVIIHGAARGADTLGERWALARGLPALAFPADWSRYGYRAGPVRNQQMLDQALPELVVAFPGGAGTLDMVRRARATDLRVWRPYGAYVRQVVGSGTLESAKSR